MEYSVEKLSGNKVKITFTAPAADFEEAVQKAYLKVRGQISVPGFRKGKAPRRLIESMYGAAVFYDDALEAVFPEAYTKAVTESGIEPVSRPEVDVETIEKGKDVVFTAEVYVMPEVKLGDYKGLEVAKHMHPVTDEQIDARLEQERKRVARSIEVTDRALENGDNAELDYSGSVDGVKFEGGTAEHQHLVIGSGSFIPGFEEQMIGMQIGEEKDLDITFPEDYVQAVDNGKKSISPDRKVDISAGYWPHRTWIFNDLLHGQAEWCPRSLALLEELLYTDNIKDAYSSYEFPQFIQSEAPNSDVSIKFINTNSDFLLLEDDREEYTMSVKNTSKKNDVLISSIECGDGAVSPDFSCPIFLGAGESVNITVTASEAKSGIVTVKYAETKKFYENQ